jgi:predicted permease
VPSEIRYAIRSLLKSPRFSVIAVVVLALGIGATSAIFSVVYNVLLKPLEYPHPERLVFVQETSLRAGGMNPTAPATYADWRDQQHVFQSIAAAEVWGASLAGVSRPEEIVGVRASASLLDVLETAPLVGRGFLPEDIRNDAGHVVLLSHSLWQRRFGGDRSVIGRSVTLNGAGYRVIGVMPPGFRFPPFWAEKAELWAPLVFPPSRANDRGGRSLRVFARLKDGVTLERAAAEMSTIARRLEQAYPDTNTDRGARVVPLREMVVGKVRTTLLVLLGAVVFLLLIACANIANLLLGRAGARQKEIALRIALGAGRRRVARQLITESLLLSIAGGAAGVALAAFLLNALQASIAEASRFTLPRFQEIGVGGPVLLFTFVVTTATGILFGLLPALQFLQPDLQAALKQGSRGFSQAAHTPLRRLLIADEIAVSLMLLVGASLLIRSFARLSAVDSGFDPRHVLTMRLVLTGSPHAPPELRNGFYRQALARVGAVPGVQSVSGINHLPLAGDLWALSFDVEGQPPPKPPETRSGVFRTVFPGYFRTMRIPLLSGRDVTDHDDAAAPRVVIVNETMARRYWPHTAAVGKRMRLAQSPEEPWYTVIGVVRNTEQGEWGEPARSEFYFPQPQDPLNFQTYLTIVARTAGDPMALAPAVQSALWSLDRDLPISDVVSLEQVVGRAVWQPRFSTTVLAAFAGLALLLAALGIYGVISFDVARRTQEIGIRMALGARPRDVLRPVLGDGVKLTLSGTAAGICGALALSRYLESMLYGVTTTDPVAIAAATVVLVAAAIAAVWVPARRATRVDPILALRWE